MHWKQQLRQLEQAEKFDEAIELMEKIISENSDDVERYIFMLYLLADLIMEPHAKMANDQGIRNYVNQDYRALSKKYFQEAYAKFAHHLDKHIRSDFLYYVGLIAVFGAQVFDIPDEQADVMILTAQREQPDNLVYNLGKPGDKELAKQLLDPNSYVRRVLSAKGALGDYIVGINEPWGRMTLKGH